MPLGPITLDCSYLGRDAATIDRVARLQLMARRNGTRLELVNVDQDLLQLIVFCGLRAVLGLEAGWQAE